MEWHKYLFKKKSTSQIGVTITMTNMINTTVVDISDVLASAGPVTEGALTSWGGVFFLGGGQRSCSEMKIRIYKGSDYGEDAGIVIRLCF